METEVIQGLAALLWQQFWWWRAGFWWGRNLLQSWTNVATSAAPVPLGPFSCNYTNCWQTQLKPRSQL